MPGLNPVEEDRIVLCELLDRLLYKGAVISGEVVISVAGVDLVYLGLEVVLTSVKKGQELFVPDFTRLSDEVK